MSNANASPGGSTLKNSGIMYAMLTIRVGIVKIPTDLNRQKQDLRDFMIGQDGEISITERFQS